MKTFRILSALFLSTLATASAQNLLTNGDFEDGKKGWAIFAPPEAKESNPQLEVVDGGREGGHAGQMSCDAPARFAITNYAKKGLFSPNQRMRVSAWIKAGEGFQAEANTPGFTVRVSMFTDGEGPQGGLASAQDGAFYIGLNGVAIRGNAVGPMNGQGVPAEWTKVEGVFESSPDVTAMNVAVFIWKGSGKLLIDDVVIENVDESVPLSPVTN